MPQDSVTKELEAIKEQWVIVKADGPSGRVCYSSLICCYQIIKVLASEVNKGSLISDRHLFFSLSLNSSFVSPRLSFTLLLQS
jgi:hypothetical protein